MFEANLLLENLLALHRIVYNGLYILLSSVNQRVPAPIPRIHQLLREARDLFMQINNSCKANLTLRYEAAESPTATTDWCNGSLINKAITPYSLKSTKVRIVFHFIFYFYLIFQTKKSGVISDSLY